MVEKIVKVIWFCCLCFAMGAGVPAAVGAMPRSQGTGNSTMRVSVASDGTQAPTASNIFFRSSDTRDRRTYHSRFMSDDGRFVVFVTASPLTADDTNTLLDVYLRDLQAGTITRVSRTWNGAPNDGDSGDYGVTISGDGKFIAFAATASNLLPYDDAHGSSDIFLYNRETSVLDIIFVPGQAGAASNPKLNDDGRYLVYDRPRESRLYDRVTGEITIVCSECGDISISPDGQFLVYTANEHREVVVFDRAANTTELIVGYDGTPGNKRSAHPEMSFDNRYVVFESTSTNLIPDDIDRNDVFNYRSDIFMYDRQTHSLRQISTNAAGDQADGSSSYPVFSRDGQKVAFVSQAWNLTTDDFNDDCNADVSIEYHTVRGHGFIANCADVYIKDLVTEGVTKVSMGLDGQNADAHSLAVSLSSNGQRVAFISAATNLVPDDTNAGCDYSDIAHVYNCTDVFVRDMPESAVAPPPAIAAGRADLSTITELLSQSPTGDPANSVSYMTRGGMSADGRYVVFDSFSGDLVPDDANNHRDVFLHDRLAHTTTRISLRADGMQANDDSYNPVITPDGHYIVFVSNAMLLPDRSFRGDAAFFRLDRLTGHLIRLTEEAYGSYAYDYGDSDEYKGVSPAISANGRYFAFYTGTPLIPLDTNDVLDVYVLDVETGALSLVSVNNEGQPGNQNSYGPVISADGRIVAFYSTATNFDPDDDDEQGDVYVHDRETHMTERISPVAVGASTYFEVTLAMSADGRYISWVTNNGSTQEGDTGGCTYPGMPPTYPPYTRNCNDVYVRDRVTGQLIRATVDAAGQQFEQIEARGMITPDGQSVVFEARTPGIGGGAALYRKNLTTGALYAFEAYATMPRVAVSPEGNTVVYDNYRNIYVTTYIPLPPGWRQFFLPMIQ